LWTRRGATSKELEVAITNIERSLKGFHGIAMTRGASEQARFATGLVGAIVVPLRMSVGEDEAQTLVAQLTTRLPIRSHSTPRIETHLLGESALSAAVTNASKNELAAAERVGFPLLLLILLGVFGSVGAAALPLALAALALLFSGAIIYLLSLVTNLSIFTTNTASMFGIGVAVDYSVIILTRVRQELAAGRDIGTAQSIASRTAGRAVIFSGLTVVLSLSAVWVMPIGVLHSMAAGAMIAVTISVLLTITLLPTLVVALGGKRITPWRARRRRRFNWQRWTTVVTQRPLLSVLAVSALLLPLCIPATKMKTNTGALEQLSRNDPTRQGFDEAQRLQGPGALGPLFVVLHTDGHRTFMPLSRAAEKARALSEGLPHVGEVSLVRLSSPRSGYAMFTVTPSINPESSEAKHLVAVVRASLARTLAHTNVSVSVGGLTASQVDEDHSIASGMWRLITVVLFAAFVILTVLLRSVVLPLKAIVMNLISVSVAYGTLVIVFQWGWLDGLLHYSAPGHVYPLVLPLLLAIVFGLSMDYEVFLLARIREQWDLCNDQRQAIANGLAATGGAITSAAFILVCVFGIFISVGNPTIKQLGVGAAVAVGLDATLIRLVLVPATMTLLGRWNWWFPRPLDRLLPVVVAHVPDSAASERDALRDETNGVQQPAVTGPLN
jgi:RND superfamily putative drug exporter